MTLALTLLTLVSLAALAAALSPVARRVATFAWHFTRLTTLALLDWVGVGGLKSRVTGTPHEPLTAPRAARLFCEAMGPVYVKAAQVVASSDGLFPKRYVSEFRACLDSVTPIPFAAVSDILREELGEYGERRIAWIESKPLASASIAQVHAATLSDGSTVIVKVQRPGLERLIDLDIRVIRAIAGFVQRWVPDAELISPVALVDDLGETLARELDFRLEAANQVRFNEIMAELGEDTVKAPRPVAALVTERVIVMERFFGVCIDDLEEVQKRPREVTEGGLVRGLRVWLACLFRHGFFHGDVHAGNFIYLDNDDIGFLDFGIVGQFDARQKRLVTDYILAFASGDYRELGRVMVEIGGVSDTVNQEELARDLREAYGSLLTQSFSEVDYGAIAPKVHRMSLKHRMRLPREFALILKQMLYFDRYAKMLAPGLNVFSDPRLISSVAHELIQARAAA